MATSYIGKLRLFKRDVRLYLLAFALKEFSKGGMQAVLLNLFLLRLNYGSEFIGLVNATNTLTFAISCLPAGALGSRWRRRSTMIMGLALMATGYALLPLTESVPTSVRATWLLSVCAIPSIGYAFFGVNGLPFLMDTTGPEVRSHAFSVQMAAGILAAVAGNLLSGALPRFLATVLDVSLQDPAPYGYPFFIAAVLMLPAVFALLRTREHHGRAEQKGVQVSGPTPYGLIIPMALVVLLGFSASVVSTFFNVYFDTALHASTSLIGALSAAAQLLAVPAALLTPVMVARWGDRRTILFGALGMALSTLPLALIPRWGAAGLGVMVEFGWSGSWIPAIQAYSQQMVSPAWRAAMSGAVLMAAGLGISAMAFGGGYVIAAWGYPAAFLLGGGLTAAGMLLFWLYTRVPRGELASPQAR